MKIAFITPAGGFGRVQFGGAEKCVIELAEAFVDQGHRVTVIAPKEFLDTAGIAGTVEQIAHPVSLKAIPSLVSALRRVGPDIVMPQLLRGVIVGRMAQLLAVPRAGVVTNFHNSLEQAFNDADTRPSRRRLVRLVVRALHGGKRVCTVAISPSNHEDLLLHDRLPTSKVALIPNWAPPEFRPSSEEDRGALRATIPGVRKGTKVLLFAGRLEHQKNPIMAVEVAGRLGDGFVLVIAGDGQLRDDVEAEVRRSGGKAVFVGHVANVHEYMAAADVVVVPSRYEGYGRVAIEAVATGTPVVASDVAGLRDAVGWLGDHDVRFAPPDDPHRWEDGVSSVLSYETSSETRIERHHKVQQRASLLNAVESYLALCRQVQPHRTV